MAVAWLDKRIAAWARRRHGEDQNPLTLHQRRIYILPSRAGLAFAALVFAMLLGSMNYSASLGFALTFLLTGVGLVCMHHTHRNLVGTVARFNGCRPVFAGQRALFQISLNNPSVGRRYELHVAHGDQHSQSTDLNGGETVTLSLPVPSQQRGLLRLSRFAVASRHPGGLFRAWSWANMRLDCVVYPHPARPGRPLPKTEQEGLDRWSDQRGEADFAGLRNFVSGDPPRRIAWKAYARSQDLLVKQFSGTQLTPTFLDWESLPDLDTEQRLSQLTRWCLDAHEHGRNYGLRLPSEEIKPGHGNAHLNRCLTALALFQVNDHGS